VVRPDKLYAGWQNDKKRNHLSSRLFSLSCGDYNAMNGDELQRLASVETEVRGIKEIVKSGFQDVKENQDRLYDHFKVMHKEHYDTDKQQQTSIALTEQRIGAVETRLNKRFGWVKITAGIMSILVPIGMMFVWVVRHIR